MTVEEIQKKHASLVTGGYTDMKPESRIKYHKQVTLEAMIQELQVIEAETFNEGVCAFIDKRIEELQKAIDNG